MKYDIAIIGGGMVGAALACALRDTPWRIVLVDAGASHANDHRLIALSHASVTFLKSLDLWNSLAPHAAAIDEVHVSHRGHFGITRLTAKEMEIAQLGYVIPAREINIALYARLNTLKNVTLLQNVKLTALSEIDARIVVAADGTYSTVRELLNIPTETIDYHQKALVTITELQRDHRHIAYERFLSTGAIAMLPLTEQRVATIWSGDEKYIDELLKLSDADFLNLLQKNFGYRLGKLTKTQQRFSYPLKFIKAKQQIHGNTILIGNAAHTIHPIAAQGLNLALSEVKILANQFHHSLSLEPLVSYFAKQNPVVNISHRLTQLFSTDFFAVNVARQLGMVGLDLCESAKKRFGRRMAQGSIISPAHN